MEWQTAQTLIRLLPSSILIRVDSADPDQTAPEEQSDQGLHCWYMSFSSGKLSLGQLQNVPYCLYDDFV